MSPTVLPDDFPDDALAVTDGDGIAALFAYDAETGVLYRTPEWHDAMAEMYLRHAAELGRDLTTPPYRTVLTVTPLAFTMAQAHSAQAVALRMRP